jgi:hypothetical protein
MKIDSDVASDRSYQMNAQFSNKATRDLGAVSLNP